jgi:co-chaperonin GroES (HSP10)
MSKESGITPRGHRVLVLPDEIDEKSEGGIYLGTATQLDREQMGQTDGIVIEMGPNAYNDQVSPWCSVGERVIFAKYSGLMRKGNDGKTYRIVNDLDIVATIEEKGNE